MKTVLKSPSHPRRWRLYLRVPLLALLVAGVTWSALSPALEAKPATRPVPARSPRLRFLVLGDWGTGGTHQKRVAAAMARWAGAGRGPGAAQSTKRLDFVATVGDNFYNDGVTSTSDPQWKTKFERVYDKSRLNVPFYAVLGNHDWRGDPAAQIRYSRTPATRWRMPGHYYRKSFPAGAAAPLADVFFLDSNLWNPAYRQQARGAAQLKWLEAGLKSSRARWQLLVQHHPLYTDGPYHRETHTLRVRRLLLPLIRKYGVDAVFAGHDHHLQRVVMPGQKTAYLISGAGGASLRSRKTRAYGPFFAEKTAGYLAVDLDWNTLRGQFLNAENRVLHSWMQGNGG